MRAHIREQTRICKDYAHFDIYPAFTHTKSRKKKKYKPTSETQKAINQRNAEKYLEMLIETNFDNNDFIVTLSYGVEPASDEQAEANAYNFIRRLEYQCKKHGFDKPCAIWCTERGKASGRYHHHLILKCPLGRDEIKNIWRDKKHPENGLVQADELQFDEKGLAPLATYLQKKPIGKQRWHRTRNMKEPIKRENDNMSQKQFKALFDEHATSEDYARAFPGYTLAGEPKRVYNEVNGCCYLSFKMYRTDSLYIRPTIPSVQRYEQARYKQKKKPPARMPTTRKNI